MLLLYTLSQLLPGNDFSFFSPSGFLLLLGFVLLFMVFQKVAIASIEHHLSVNMRRLGSGSWSL